MRAFLMIPELPKKAKVASTVERFSSIFSADIQIGRHFSPIIRLRMCRLREPATFGHGSSSFIDLVSSSVILRTIAKADTFLTRFCYPRGDWTWAFIILFVLINHCSDPDPDKTIS